MDQAIAWSDDIAVGELRVSVQAILKHLTPLLTESRRARLDEVVAQRSLHMVPILENIYDRGNVSAVMRSSEAFGFVQMALVDLPGAKFKAANRVTRGAEKWLDVVKFNDPVATVKHYQQRGYQVWATDLETNVSIEGLDWSRPTAIVLGNEKDGISPAMRSSVDGCFRIPMQGFSQSFNISVAAALICYRARMAQPKPLTPAERERLMANYVLRCFDNPGVLLRNSLRLD